MKEIPTFNDFQIVDELDAVIMHDFNLLSYLYSLNFHNGHVFLLPEGNKT